MKLDGPITQDEFARLAQEIINKREKYRDAEDIHLELDELMEHTLTELGFGAGIAHIQNTERWYA